MTIVTNIEIYQINKKADYVPNIILSKKYVFLNLVTIFFKTR